MSETQYHYGVMRRAINLIDQAEGQELSLDQLASQMQMSPAHFQRTFSQWVGVSPKRYQQYLTLGHAKSLLRERFTTFETADNVGLSGGGRLHDLFLRWEAMSPGEFASGGAGLTLRYGWYEGPFGQMLAMGTDRGLCGLAFAAETGPEATFADMCARWPKAEFVQDQTHLAKWVGNIFGKNDATKEIPLHLIGAPFQLKVWEALLEIPSGMVTTYGDIAAHVGNPRAHRAVGTAVGRNPVSWLIPCHRAMRKSGGLGGYHWGLEVKRAMLAYEAARADG